MPTTERKHTEIETKQKFEDLDRIIDEICVSDPQDDIWTKLLEIYRYSVGKQLSDRFYEAFVSRVSVCDDGYALRNITTHLLSQSQMVTEHAARNEIEALQFCINDRFQRHESNQETERKFEDLDRIINEICISDPQDDIWTKLLEIYNYSFKQQLSDRFYEAFVRRVLMCNDGSALRNITTHLLSQPQMVTEHAARNEIEALQFCIKDRFQRLGINQRRPTAVATGVDEDESVSCYSFLSKLFLRRPVPVQQEPRSASEQASMQTSVQMVLNQQHLRMPNSAHENRARTHKSILKQLIEVHRPLAVSLLQQLQQSRLLLGSELQPTFAEYGADAPEKTLYNALQTYKQLIPILQDTHDALYAEIKATCDRMRPVYSFFNDPLVSGLFHEQLFAEKMQQLESRLDTKVNKTKKEWCALLDVRKDLAKKINTAKQKVEAIATRSSEDFDSIIAAIASAKDGELVTKEAEADYDKLTNILQALNQNRADLECEVKPEYENVRELHAESVLVRCENPAWQPSGKFKQALDTIDENVRRLTAAEDELLEESGNSQAILEIGEEILTGFKFREHLVDCQKLIATKLQSNLQKCKECEKDLLDTSVTVDNIGERLNKLAGFNRSVIDMRGLASKVPDSPIDDNLSATLGEIEVFLADYGSGLKVEDISVFGKVNLCHPHREQCLNDFYVQCFEELNRLEELETSDRCDETSVSIRHHLAEIIELRKGQISAMVAEDIRSVLGSQGADEVKRIARLEFAASKAPKHKMKDLEKKINNVLQDKILQKHIHVLGEDVDSLESQAKAIKTHDQFQVFSISAEGLAGRVRDTFEERGNSIKFLFYALAKNLSERIDSAIEEARVSCKYEEFKFRFYSNQQSAEDLCSLKTDISKFIKQHEECKKEKVISQDIRELVNKVVTQIELCKQAQATALAARNIEIADREIDIRNSVFLEKCPDVLKRYIIDECKRRSDDFDELMGGVASFVTNGEFKESQKIGLNRLQKYKIVSGELLICIICAMACYKKITSSDRLAAVLNSIDCSNECHGKLYNNITDWCVEIDSDDSADAVAVEYRGGVEQHPKQLVQASLARLAGLVVCVPAAESTSGAESAAVRRKQPVPIRQPFAKLNNRVFSRGGRGKAGTRTDYSLPRQRFG